MKVLQINAVNAVLSTGRNCSEIAAYLQANGVSCITAYSTGPATENAYRISAPWECKLHALQSRLTGLQGYFSPLSTRRLLRLLRRTKPDIVHLNNLHANYLHIPALLTFLAKNDIPTVITLHDCWPFTGKCTYYTAIHCQKWKSGCFGCPKLKTDHVSWLFDRTPKMWKDKKNGWRAIPRLAVIGVSDWITEQATLSPMFSEAKIIRRIYNWIDMRLFYPRPVPDLKQKLGIADKKLLLGVASHWENRKGLNLFTALAPLLREDEVILLVGNLPADAALPESILSVPAVDSAAELADYYSAADIFLQLSAEETFGKVVAEALACGTPVITLRGTANPELVDAACGIVAESAAPTVLRDAVSAVLEKGKSAFSDACVSRARTLFDAENNLKQYLDTYKELIQEG